MGVRGFGRAVVFAAGVLAGAPVAAHAATPPGGLQAFAHGHRIHGLRYSAGGRLLTDVYVKGDEQAAATRLRAAGMTVRGVADGVVEGWVAPSASAAVSALGSAVPVIPGVLAGTTSEGDAAHDGPAARAAGATGAGVPVGVISDTIDKVEGGIADSRAAGDLPADVEDLTSEVADPAKVTGDDEGRAMSEIVYDLAPGVSRFLFTPGLLGSVAKVQGIDNLVAGGARVIVDDTGYYDQPFFQDGPIAQAVNRARSHNVLYVAAAGNGAQTGWQGTFTRGARQLRGLLGLRHDADGRDRAERRDAVARRAVG